MMPKKSGFNLAHSNLTKLKKKPERDIEKHYTQQQFVAKLHQIRSQMEGGTEGFFYLGRPPYQGFQKRIVEFDVALKHTSPSPSLPGTDRGAILNALSCS